MKVLIAQINPTVGDLKGNSLIIKEKIALARQSECDVVIFPELATVGYPPRDLLYMDELWAQHAVLIDELMSTVRNGSQITVIVGGLHEEMLSGGRHARYNAAWILDPIYGKRVVHKQLLPCYDVFDENRYFTPAVEPCLPIPIRSTLRGTTCDVRCDVLICEDIWNNEFMSINEPWLPASYTTDPVAHLSGDGPLFVLNGSPWWQGKIQQTEQLIGRIAMRLDRPVVWCNQVGAHDDIITGGYSMAALPPAKGSIAWHNQKPDVRQLKAFTQDEMIVQFSDDVTHHGNLGPAPDDVAEEHLPIGINKEMREIYQALVLHMTDYKRRCGFERAVLGLSGGIDSAVVAAIAAQVFEPHNVTGIAMPSPYSSEGSIEDAKQLAKNLKIRFEIKNIEESYNAIKNLFLSGGKQKFDNSVVDENIQPRLRACILMAHSNEYDPCLLLTTGNKSELSTGFCTLYGDMCGGLAVISDLWKTQVYELARYINNRQEEEIIPISTIEKPPSAELAPDQKDTDSLPPYEELDPILQEMVEGSIFPRTDDLKKMDLLTKIYRLYRRSEFKRQQMPPGPKISKRAFGTGRRMPIAANIQWL